MSLGNISLDKLTVINKADNSEYVISDVTLLRENRFSHSRSIDMLAMSNGAYASDVNVFQPEDISFQFNHLVNLDTLKAFLRGFNRKFKLKLEFAHKTLYCDIMVKGDTVQTFTNLDKWHINFLRTSHFYKIVTYTHDVSSGGGSGTPYDYTYDFTYSGYEQGYLSSSLSINNHGDTTAGAKVRISGLAENPSIGVNAYAGSTFNSYISGATVNLGEALLYSTIVGDYTITVGGNDYSGYRDFTTVGFIEIPSGENTLYFQNLTYLEIDIYEYYYNI